MHRLLIVATGVPVPDLGLPPPPYSPSALVLVLGVIAIVSIIAFVLPCLAAGRLADRGISPLRVGLLSLLAMVVTMGAAAFVSIREQGAHERAEEDYSVAIDTSQSQVVDGLEAYYEITIPDPFDIPLENRTSPSPIDIESADGGSSCWVATVDGVYDIRCGGDRDC